MLHSMLSNANRSFKPILLFSVVMGIAVIAFAQFAHLCFGAKVNLGVSLPYPIMGPLFFFIISFCSLCYLSLLVDAYSEIREEQGAGFSHLQVGTFMFNFFLNKIKAFHSHIACLKAQLSHKFLSKVPTMGNSHLFLVIVDTFVLNHSKTISSTVLTTKVLNIRMTKVQNLSQIALMDALIPLNCLRL